VGLGSPRPRGMSLGKGFVLYFKGKYVLLVVVIEKHLALAFVQILSLLICKIVAN
jgi:hypothetical protein